MSLDREKAREILRAAWEHEITGWSEVLDRLAECVTPDYDTGIAPWVEGVQRNGDFQTITFTDGSSVWTGSEQDDQGRWRDGRGVNAVLSIARQAGIPAPSPVDPYRDDFSVRAEEKVAAVLALHRPVMDSSWSCVLETCAECHEDWPCSTAGACGITT